MKILACFEDVWRRLQTSSEITCPETKMLIKRLFLVSMSYVVPMLIVLKVPHEAYHLMKNYSKYPEEISPATTNWKKPEKTNLAEINLSSLYDESHAIRWSEKTVIGKVYHDVKDRFRSAVMPQNPEIDSFLQQRDVAWINASESGSLKQEEQCDNCAVNAACYNSSFNLWHPTKACELCKISEL